MKHELSKLAEKYFSLEGKRGIVTGGSAGIGKAIALTLAQAGAEVFIFSRSGRFKNNTSAGNIFHIKADVSDTEKCREAIDKIGEEGLHFLVNNAGTSTKGRITEINEEDWDRIQEVNVRAAMNLSRFAYPYLKKAEGAGRIVNITSMAAHLGFNDVVAYTVSKTALLGLTRGLAVEWASENILVNAVSPGWIKTDLLETVLDEERERKILNRMPLHRYGTTQDIANMVWYLLSPAAGYITGQDFSVDGGALAYGY